MTTSNATRKTKKPGAGSNSLWLMAEKMLSMLGLFFVSAFVAKYIGPEMVGTIAFWVTSFQIILVISQFGSENIIIRRLSNNLRSGITLAKVSITIRTLLFFIITLPLLWWMFLQHRGGMEFLFCCAIAAGTFFTTIDLASIYNDATLNSKVNTLFNLLGLVTAILFRFLIVELELNILLLTLPIIMTTAIPCVLRIIHFNRKVMHGRLKSKSQPGIYLKYLITTGGTMLLASISVAIYPRVNLYFLSQFHNDSILGIYSVAVTLSTSWSFILLAVITSHFPAIYNEKDEHQSMHRASRLNIYIVLTSASVMIGFALFGQHFINLLYGPAFASAWLPALILCGGTTFSALGTVSSRFILKYSGFRYITYKSLVTLIICIPCAWYFITHYSLVGAACSSSFIELFSSTLLNYGFQNGKVLKMHFFMLTRSSALSGKESDHR